MPIKIIDMKIIKFLLATGMMIFAITLTTAQSSTATIEKTPVTATAEKTITIKVKGVGCSKDCQSISTNVADLIGVSKCETLKKGATTTFSVTYDPSVATEAMIYAAVENTPGCSKQAARPYKVKL